MVRVRRQGKILPGFAAMQDAVLLSGCKVMYTGAYRTARPMSGGGLLELVGNSRRR